MSVTNQLRAESGEMRVLCERWNITELALFGSAARGQANLDSDIDLLVTFNPAAMTSFWDMVQLKLELEEMFEKSVDLVEKGAVRNPYWRAAMERDLTIVFPA